MSPFTQRGLPFSGRTPMSRQNSYKAAVAAGATRGEKKQRVLAYLKTVRAATDQNIAEGARLPLASVCSLRNHLMHEQLVKQVGRVMGRYGHPVTLWATHDRELEAFATFQADDVQVAVDRDDVQPAADAPADPEAVCGS